MTNSSSERPSEFDLIAKLFAPLADAAPGALGLKDDAAIAAPPAGHELVITTDALIESVHFRNDDPADSIAKKALRVNLSDLAAKGAAPIGYLLALSLPARTDMRWLEEFTRGLRSDQDAFGISLYGGDTTATPGPLTLAITAFGSVPTGTMLKRSGAKAGDDVYVSGTIGDAGAGLGVLAGKTEARGREALVARYRVPEPRLKLGTALRAVASASLDVSDGLIADLAHIADVSDVRIVLEAAAIPISAAARAFWGAEAVTRAATAGDDYEIAFTAPPANAASVAKAAKSTGTPVTRIGRVETGSGTLLVDSHGAAIALKSRGYTHF
ncbi:MAG TPA: thiamine-phosphate kinase [Rhizomicrobium sp.]